jgi:transcriptional regulator with XRE-family HTH domain
MTIEEKLDIVITRIRKIRIEEGISQQELANIANFSQSFLANVESGKKKPSLLTILRIAEALNVNPREFFSESPTEITKEEIKSQIINLLEKI